MTREMTLEKLINLKKQKGRFSINEHTALNMAIKALDQEPILDKIRAEIEHLTYYWCEVNPRTVIDDVLQIIDKYKAEGSEE